MSSPRKNTLVVDVSVLPKASVLKQFLTSNIELNWNLVRCIQINNVRNCVLIVMCDTESAALLSAAHNLKHCMTDEKKEIKIPVYVDNEVTKVRVLDVHPDTSDESVTQKLREYGEVLSIEPETWRDHFRGFDNGVRIVRMKLTQHIPSCVIINYEKTLVSYENQRQISKDKEANNPPNAEEKKANSKQQHQQQETTNNKTNQRTAASYKTKLLNETQNGQKQKKTPAGGRDQIEVENANKSCSDGGFTEKLTGFFAARDTRPIMIDDKGGMDFRTEEDSDSGSDLQTVSEIDVTPKKLDHSENVWERRKKKLSMNCKYYFPLSLSP